MNVIMFSCYARFGWLMLMKFWALCVSKILCVCTLIYLTQSQTLILNIMAKRGNDISCQNTYDFISVLLNIIIQMALSNVDCYLLKILNNLRKKITLYTITSFQCHFGIYAHTYVALKTKNYLQIPKFSPIPIVFKEGFHLLHESDRTTLSPH